MNYVSCKFVGFFSYFKKLQTYPCIDLHVTTFFLLSVRTNQGARMSGSYCKTRNVLMVVSKAIKRPVLSESFAHKDEILSLKKSPVPHAWCTVRCPGYAFLVVGRGGGGGYLRFLLVAYGPYSAMSISRLHKAHLVQIT